MLERLAYLVKFYIKKFSEILIRHCVVVFMRSVCFIVFQLFVLLNTSLLYAGVTPEMSLDEVKVEVANFKEETKSRFATQDINQIELITRDASVLFDSIHERITKNDLSTSHELSFLREIQYFVVSMLFAISLENVSLTTPKYLDSGYVFIFDNDEALSKTSNELRSAARFMYMLCRDIETVERDYILFLTVWLKHAGYYKRRDVASSLRVRIYSYLHRFRNVNAERTQHFQRVAAECEDTIQTWDIVDKYSEN